jgi:acyl-CoA thioesterase-2
VTDLWSDLLSTLKVDAGPSRTHFSATNQCLEYHRVVGGQLLAQFIRAACLICPEKSVK